MYRWRNREGVFQSPGTLNNIFACLKVLGNQQQLVRKTELLEEAGIQYFIVDLDPSRRRIGFDDLQNYCYSSLH
jgi:hypothetical protein